MANLGAFRRYTLPLFAIGFAALVFIIGLSFWLVQRTQSFSEELDTTRQSRDQTLRLLSALQDAETGQRGFLLTRDPSYLEPNRAAESAIPVAIASLRPFYESDVAAAKQFADLEKTIKNKLDELNRTIDLTQAGRFDEAMTLVGTDLGKRLMDEARAEVNGLLAYADRRNQMQLSSQRDNVLGLRWATLAGAIVILAVAGTLVAIVVRDTNRLIQAEREIRSLNVNLEGRVQERTVALSRANDEIQRFAYIVSHDLRAPLVNIMGFTSELEISLNSVRRFLDAQPPENTDGDFQEAKVAAAEDIPEALSFIRSSTGKMDLLINAILNLSREGRRVLVADPLDLGEVCENAAKAIHHQLQAVGGEIVIAKRLPNIFSDRLALDQVIGNLFDNAVKYRSPDRALRIDVDGRIQGDTVSIDIKDNGRGIDERDHERIFELFRRAGLQDQKGDGVGLSHVRALVRRMGGDIKVKSSLNKGSVFHIDLPVYLKNSGAG